MWYLQRVNTLLSCNGQHMGARAYVFQHHLLLALSTRLESYPFSGMPSRIASTMSGASSVSRSSRLTKLRVTFSASPADRHLPFSSNLQRSPLAGFLGSAAGCSPPDYSQAGRSHPQQSSRSTSVA